MWWMRPAKTLSESTVIRAVYVALRYFIFTSERGHVLVYAISTFVIQTRQICAAVSIVAGWVLRIGLARQVTRNTVVHFCERGSTTIGCNGFIVAGISGVETSNIANFTEGAIRIYIVLVLAGITIGISAVANCHTINFLARKVIGIALASVNAFSARNNVVIRISQTDSEIIDFVFANIFVDFFTCLVLARAWIRTFIVMTQLKKSMALSLQKLAP